jgi:hypothetical protein
LANLLKLKKCPAGFAFGSHAGQNIHANKHSQNKKNIAKGKKGGAHFI